MPMLRNILSKEGLELPASALRSSELEANVAEMFLATGAPCGAHSALFRPWPGPEKNVSRWFVLEDGMAIGLTGKPDQPEGVVRFPFNKINHLDWNRIRTCRVVHRAGSFTKAGQILDITQSAVSRQIAALEHDLGSDLFIRGGAGLVPTEAGEYFLDTVERMWEALALGLARLNELREEPEGPLALTTTEGFGSAWLASRISRFHEIYPHIEVSLLLIDNAELNLRQREADCAIRFQHPVEPLLVRKFIGDFSYHVYGSRSYLERKGIPETLDDLEHHDLIVYGDGIGRPPVEKINWLLTEGMPEGTMRHPAAQINSVYGIYRAVESGMGLAALPFYMSERSEELVEVLPDVGGPPIPVYFVYPEELRPSRRISVLRDFLVSEMRASWQSLRSCVDA